jgi:hypothetical protein
MLPILVQLHPSPPLTKNTAAPSDIYQMVIVNRFVPEGAEDYTIIGAKNTTLAVWREEDQLQLSIFGKQYRHDIVEETDELRINTPKQELTINGQLVEASGTIDQSWPVLEKMMSSKNDKMFNHVANYADYKVSGEKLLRLACIYGPASSVEHVMEKGKMHPDTAVLYGGYWTGLMLAAINGQEDIVKMLVEKYGADVEKKEVYGKSALSLAIACNHLGTVKTLVEMGAGRREKVKVPSVDAVKRWSNDGYVVNMGGSDREDINTYLAREGVQRE